MRLEENGNYASKGVANAGSTTGIIGTTLGGLATLINGGTLFGNNARTAGVPAVNSDDEYVNRYEAKQSARIAELETEIKLRDANTYTDGKMLEMYQYVDGRLRNVEGQIAQLQSLTKMVIPKSSICPEPMDRYNSWTAPTITSTT